MRVTKKVESYIREQVKAKIMPKYEAEKAESKRIIGIKNDIENRIQSQFISTIIFEICRDDLINHLHQVFIVFMESNRLVIGFKFLFDQAGKADLCSEFFYQKKSCIGG